jgi:teichuronic acid biosynthesis glycosyltransferase TuaG
MPVTNHAAPVSVIIPCYRCLETVERALDSVLNQTRQPSEILLIDDASADGTLDLLYRLEELHAPRVRVIPLAKNGGPGLARNAGWDAATQPWLAFLDADDAWHPRKLEIQWAWLELHPEAVLCGHASQFTTGALDIPLGETTGAIRLSLLRMLISNRLPTRSVMLRKDLTFRFRGKYVTEDYLLWLEVIISGFPSYRLEPCLAFSLRPDFSPGGYSGQLWAHEKRELAALKLLYANGQLSLPVYLLSAVWSCTKYLRRLWLMRRAK